ncbi:thiamine pyrophosphate-binding protein [Haemophilus influenzae]|uniref:Acetolactate synthase isozyme 2 large subunit n=1 Tax=Haemophilus influenzae TaxID=727 RepID=A0A2S9S3H0_HAEIF|nr:ACT domain-containing protein [Haemophilus influenzae]EEW77693.1 thiamine pyrophosphate-requiring enzyme [Haemophilus influenzae NT127]MCK8794249.1 thiamine pyrophosphate-binding protein [Haemophilus influenzae]MCK8830266.1 thiamine pyrophosphate-binding protein [Haemophilus influenzae]MCK8841062.1 thiamine pyrophosphate-binding protein [Haemophilus influenzae]MCK9057337.1 thiamine pyrophosphate-binding protein [Haemophilus influenzae]
MTGAQLVMACLKAHHVTTLFGYPGGAIMPTYDALYDAGLDHLLCRNEQGIAMASNRKPNNAIICTDVGQHKMWSVQHILRVARHRGFTVTTMEMTLIETQVRLKITVKSDRTLDLLVNQLVKLPDVLMVN